MAPFHHFLNPGPDAQVFPARHLRPYLAVARPPQERAEVCEALPVRVRPEGRQRVRQPLPLREGGQPRHRPDRSLYTGQ